LLREAGADVYLTRSADKDMLSGPDSTVAADLQVRVDMVDSVRPEVVVSIHHNAQPDRDTSRNAVETYYKIGDPASRDLAFAVHRHLMRNLGIEEGEVRPGNYYILREVDVPAILGEGSYLTHPPVEAKLRLSEKQRLEAEAYFLGILEFFSRGTPVIHALTPRPEENIFAEVPVLAYAVTDVGGVGIDPNSVEMVVNGALVDAELDPAGTIVRYPLPWDSPNGTYHVTLSVRNLLGNSSRLDERTVELDLPPEHAVFDTYPETVPHGGGTVFVRARLLDRRGLSIADGRNVAISAWHRRSATAEWVRVANAGRDVTDVRVASGVAEFVVDVPGGASELRLEADCQTDTTASTSTARSSEPSSARPAQESRARSSERSAARALRFEHIVRLSPVAEGATRAIVVLSRHSGAPIEGARFADEEGRLAAQFRAGRFLLADSVVAGEVRVHATGHRPVVVAGEKFKGGGSPDTLRLDAWYQGKLAGKRIIVNPTGEVRGQSVRGRLGLSGAYANLQVARYLRDDLEAAGALVRLARWSEETPLDRDIVASTNRFGADCYIEIRYRASTTDTTRSVRTFHFPGSAKGRAVASAVGEALGLAVEAVVEPPFDTVTYPLQQTSCPAIIVEPPSIGRIDEELRLSEPWYQREQAYGIFCGLLQQAGVDSVGTLRVVLVADTSAAGSPGSRAREDVSDWLVTVDDTWRLLTSPEDASARFRCLPPGPHRVVLQRGDRRLGPFAATVASGDTGEIRVPVPARP
jgi:N-acetylmuramoyl-L-alanine amidase